MVYGKRRVGKTTLIQKALDNCPYQTVYFECLKGTVQENIDSLVDELVRAKILPVALSFSTLQDVFTYLNTLPQKMVVVIDEYPYLKVMNEPTTVDSVFQSIIDNRLGNIELILSGSHIGMMKDLLQEKNALYINSNKPTAGRTKAIHRRLELSFNLYLLLLFVGQNRASKSLLHITPDFPYLAVFSTNKTFEGQLKP